MPIFESLTPEDLKVLASHAEHQVAAPGEVIFREGDSESHSLYLIEEGAVDISAERERHR